MDGLGYGITGPSSLTRGRRYGPSIVLASHGAPGRGSCRGVSAGRKRLLSHLSFLTIPVRCAHSREFHREARLMRYVLMICGDEAAAATLSPAEGAALLAEYDQFGQEMGSRGILKSGERLRPSSTATTVQVREGRSSPGTGRLPRPKSRSAESSPSSARTSMRPSRLLRRSPPPVTGRLK